MLVLWVALSGGVMAEWTPEMSKSANKSSHDPPSPKGWYPPVEPSTHSPTSSVPANSPPASPAPAATPAGSNGGWTPEMSKSAGRHPSEPPSPRGWYPPTDGSPDVPQNMGDPVDKILTSNLANPLIQGGKAIGKAYEAADRGDNMGATIEAADGIGRLASIGHGAGKGAVIGSSIAGPVGGVIGGIIGGFLGNKGWEYTGGMINEKNREMLQELNARQQAEIQRQNMPRGSRPSGSDRCGGPCGR